MNAKKNIEILIIGYSSSRSEFKKDTISESSFLILLGSVSCLPPRYVLGIVLNSELELDLLDSDSKPPNSIIPSTVHSSGEYSYRNLNLLDAYLYFLLSIREISSTLDFLPFTDSFIESRAAVPAMCTR